MLYDLLFSSDVKTEIDSLKLLITSIQDMVMHNITTMWAVAAIVLTIVGLLSFSSIKNIVNKKVEETTEALSPKISKEIKLEIKSLEKTRGKPEHIMPTFLNGAKSIGSQKFHYEKISEELVILSGKIQVKNHSMIFELPGGYRPVDTIYLKVPAYRVANNYLYESFVEVISTGVIQAVSGESGINGESILYFNNVIIRVS